MKRTISFTLRMPEDLHAQLEQVAQDSRHSMNALALDAIRSSLQPRPKTTVAEDVRQALQTDLSKLEERILAHLGPGSHISELHIGTAVVTGSFPEIDPAKVQAAFSPTGRLRERGPNESTLELAVKSFRESGPIDRGEYAARFQHAALTKGEHVASVDEYWRRASGNKSQPLKGQVWVITGSLETMTRDRAREILMELGATVAGTVSPETRGLIWGNGAGSKLEQAAKHKVRLWNERQFIHMIQGMGVDMPLPKTPVEQHLVTPGALEWDGPVHPECSPGWGWTINTGVMPEAAKGKRVDLQHFDGRFSRGELADDFDWALDGADSDISVWRLSSIELQPQVQPRATK